MPKLLTIIPHRFYLAVSGGFDSMFALNFFTRYKPKNLTILHWNHGTSHSSSAENFVKKVAHEKNLDIHVYNLNGSKENEWRQNRINIIENDLDRPVVTAHHIGDCVEWYIMRALRGNQDTFVPVTSLNGKILHPFLLWNHDEMIDWYLKADIEPVFIEDPTNQDSNFTERNLLRNEIIPKLKNTILHNTILKNIRRYYNGRRFT